MRRNVFIIFVFLMLLGAFTNALGNEKKKEISIYYEEINVLPGDTFWKISNRYSSDGMSKEEYVDYIMEFNHTKSDKLQAGERIVIPILKYIKI